MVFVDHLVGLFLLDKIGTKMHFASREKEVMKILNLILEIASAISDDK